MAELAARERKLLKAATEVLNAFDDKWGDDRIIEEIRKRLPDIPDVTRNELALAFAAAIRDKAFASTELNIDKPTKN